MKRTNSANNFPSSRMTAPTGQSTPLAGESTTGRYLAADVARRISDLASDRERANNRFDVKLQAPQIYADDPQRPGLLHLPMDVVKVIFSHFNKGSVRKFGSTCREGYLYRQMKQPMYRLPGLLKDIGRLRVDRFSADPGAFKAYLEALAPGGAYDAVLLTAMSKTLRCAAATAMQLWSHNKKLHQKDKGQLITLNDLFIKKNYDPGFLEAIETIFDWLLQGYWRECTLSDSLNDFFNATSLDVHAKSVIFNAYLNHLYDSDIIFDAKSRLPSIACDHSLNLKTFSVGLFSLMYRNDGRFIEKLAIFLWHEKKESLKSVITEIIDAGIDKKLFNRDLQRILRITGLLFDASHQLDARGKSIVLRKLISIIPQLFSDHTSSFLHFNNNCLEQHENEFFFVLDSLFLPRFDLSFNPENTTEINLQRALKDAQLYNNADVFSLGFFIRSLSERASALKNAKVGYRLLEEISNNFSPAKPMFPHFNAYIAIKMENLTFHFQ